MEEARHTIIITPLMLLARASSPLFFFQYSVDSQSSPSVMVKPWEKTCTGVGAGSPLERCDILGAGARLLSHDFPASDEAS